MSSAREKARAVAGALAERDQERMRSYKFDALATIPPADPVTVEGVKYTIESKAKWITDDANATPACGDSAKQSEYLKITTTVTSNLVGKRQRQGHRRDHRRVAGGPVGDLRPGPRHARRQGAGPQFGAGIEGLMVSAALKDGAALVPEKTNDKGCALFRSVKIGTYVVSVNTPGYVNEKGVQLHSTEVTVNPNSRERRQPHL